MLRFLYHLFSGSANAILGCSVYVIFLADFCWHRVCRWHANAGVLGGCSRHRPMIDLEYDADIRDMADSIWKFTPQSAKYRKTDKIAFLLDKLKRLEYKKVAELIPRLSQLRESTLRHWTLVRKMALFAFICGILNIRILM